MNPGHIAYLITEPKNGKMQLLEHDAFSNIQTLVESIDFRKRHGGEKLEVVIVKHSVVVEPLRETEEESHKFYLIPPEGVSRTDHIKTFIHFVQMLQMKAYEKCISFQPNRMIIAPNIWPIIRQQADYVDIGHVPIAPVGPVRIGTLEQCRIKVFADSLHPASSGVLMYEDLVGNTESDTIIVFNVVEERSYVPFVKRGKEAGSENGFYQR